MIYSVPYLPHLISKQKKDNDINGMVYYGIFESNSNPSILPAPTPKPKVINSASDSTVPKSAGGSGFINQPSSDVIHSLSTRESYTLLHAYNYLPEYTVTHWNFLSKTTSQVLKFQFILLLIYGYQKNSFFNVMKTFSHMTALTN